jgi:enoyl-CoA hydratase/carnithine racemase
MDLKTIRYEVDDRVACITLNRPDRLNAWTGRMHTEYRWALASAQADEHVRVVVVTGAGRGFCAGADAKALESHAERGGYDPGTPEDLATPGYGVHPGLDNDFTFHLGLRTPVIAAINGPVAGVGLVLACYCDVRFAAAGAKLTTAHGRLNLPAEYGLSWILPRIIGLGRASDLLLSSRVVLAEEALDLGLVNRVLPPDEVLAAALDYARTLAHEVAPRSLRETKRAIALDLFRDLGASVDDANRLLDDMMGEPDFAEGARALTERRPPQF